MSKIRWFRFGDCEPPLHVDGYYRHGGLGTLSRRTGKREQGRERLITATTMYREMQMPF
jgi:hypothetical protein